MDLAIEHSHVSGLTGVSGHWVEPGDGVQLADGRRGPDNFCWHAQSSDCAGNAAGLLVHNVHGPPQLPHRHPR